MKRKSDWPFDLLWQADSKSSSKKVAKAKTQVWEEFCKAMEQDSLKIFEAASPNRSQGNIILSPQLSGRKSQCHLPAHTEGSQLP